ncbi:MAG TPA: CsbD family protein [Ktedonobacterales bacterium]
MYNDQDEDSGKNLKPERRSLAKRGEAHRRGGTKDKIAGKAQETLGHLKHDRSDVAKGKAKQGKGVLKEGLGKAESRLGSTDDS